MSSEPDLNQRLEILKAAKNVAVVGVSDKPERPSYGVVKWLMANTPYKLFFVNPVITELFGQPVYKSLAEIPEKIDLVDVFRNPRDIPPVMDAAIEIGAKSFWMQLGISEAGAAEKGRAAGLDVVQNACIKIEYQHLLK
jgi:uncharacterized protein